MQQQVLEGFDAVVDDGEWFDGPPPMTGWWRTRRVGANAKDGNVRRFYFAGTWSEGVVVGVYDDEETLDAMSTDARNQQGIQWQGDPSGPADDYAYELTLVKPYRR